MIGLSFEGLCDVDGRGTRSTTSQRVDPAVDAAVANATDQEPTEAVLEIADEMRSNRFHIPTGTQTGGGQLFGIEAVKKSGDGPALVGNRREYLLTFTSAQAHISRLSGHGRGAKGRQPDDAENQLPD
jgi:hypothetical protein